MVENKKRNKFKDKTPERSDCKTVCPYFFSFKRVEKTFSTGILPKYRMFQEHYGHNPLICLVFQPCNKQAGTLQKRHSSLFTLHIPAVIIINRTIPNINTNSQIYYKESKEEFEIFLCGSSVNQYIDCYVLFSLRGIVPAIVFYQLLGIT